MTEPSIHAQVWNQYDLVVHGAPWAAIDDLARRVFGTSIDGIVINYDIPPLVVGYVRENQVFFTKNPSANYPDVIGRVIGDKAYMGNTYLGIVISRPSEIT